MGNRALEAFSFGPARTKIQATQRLASSFTPGSVRSGQSYFLVHPPGPSTK